VSFTVRFLISITVLALLIRSVSWSDISEALVSANRRLLAVGSLFAVPIVLLKGVKWWLLLRHAGIGVPLRKTALSYMAGLGFGLVTPGRVGELARIWVLGLDKKDYLVAGTLVLVDRLTDLAALLAVVSFSVFYFFGAWWLAGYLLLGAVGGALWFWLTRRFRNAPDNAHGKGGFLAKVMSAAAGLSPQHIAIYVTLGLMVTMCGVCMVYTFLNAMQPVAFIDCLSAVPPVFMNSILPVTIGGVGVRELIMTAVCEQIGVESAVAVSAILLYFAGSMLLPGALGLALFAVFRPRSTSA
jgi:uncharacterized membrane protein YbhN (UPF0104 family)